jgi:antitoxin (DNA-binding transcriptional repressor) of toxin-antitoxin stability system
MKFASVRDFKLHATRYLKGRSDVYITRRGKPVAVLSPLKEKSPEKVMAEMGQILREAGISKKELLDILEEAREEVYRA